MLSFPVFITCACDVLRQGFNSRCVRIVASVGGVDDVAPLERIRTFHNSVARSLCGFLINWVQFVHTCKDRRFPRAFFYDIAPVFSLKARLLRPWLSSPRVVRNGFEASGDLCEGK
ncbi:hypothetical protein KC326_g131 [Hortaea werneckii]|nr:hypothetical protein KC326_g131 [Hortaea werneckii]